MIEIQIDVEFARQIARQLVLSGEAAALIARDLEVAVSAVDDYACQGRASEKLAGELVELERVARRWEELGARLHTLADRFDAADYAQVLVLLGQGAWIDAFGGRGPTNEECLARVEELFLTEGREWTEEEWKLFFARGREWTDKDWERFLEAARGESLEWRQAFVRAIIADESLLDGFEPEEATLVVAILLEGSLTWTLPWDTEGRSDHFLAWVETDWRSEEAERRNLPDPAAARMNCWQYVLYAAYISGQVTHAELAALHREAQSPATTNDVVIASALGAWKAQRSNPWHEGDEPPPRGSLVFFDGTGHVAISLGTRNDDDQAEILSLFTVPYDGDQPVYSVQRTTIEQVLDGAEEEEDWIVEVVSSGPNLLSQLEQ